MLRIHPLRQRFSDEFRSWGAFRWQYAEKMQFVPSASCFFKLLEDFEAVGYVAAASPVEPSCSEFVVFSWKMWDTVMCW